MGWRDLRGGLGRKGDGGFEVVGLRGEGLKGQIHLWRLKCEVKGPKGRVGDKEGLGGRGFEVVGLRGEGWRGVDSPWKRELGG